VPASTAAQIRDREITHISEERSQMLLLEKNDRILFHVVDGGPAIIALLRREVLDRPLR
jgi:hypothetical protein